MYKHVIIASFIISYFDSLVYSQCLGVMQCQCETTTDNKQIINCRNKQLTSVPKFTQSTIQYAELTLEGNQIQNLQEASFGQLSLNTINLKDNPISYIAPTAFIGIEADLKTLILGLSQSIAFPSKSLSGLINLKSLEIYNYGGTNLPTDAFNGLNQLENLALFNGQLNDVITPSLDVLRILDTLILNSNRFTSIPVAALRRLPSLRKLVMINNLINTLDANSFNMLSNIEEIDLSSNNLAANIAPDTFQSLTKMKYLTFSTCQLLDPSLRAFVSLKSLTILNLQNNGITTIPDNLFNQPTNLLQLNLAENKISKLSDNIFKGFPIPLMNLNLGRNPLVITLLNNFTSLVSLERFLLHSIQRVSLSVQSFQSMNNLKILDFSFTPVDDSIFSALTPLIRLQELNLSSCSLKSVPESAFKNNANIRDIDLSRNSLTNLPANIFDGLEKMLARLNLDSNRITSLNRCVFNNFDPLKLSLNDNPLRCDCNLKWLFNKIKNQNAMLSWKCDDGTLFSSKGDSFNQCPSDSPCLVTNTSTSNVLLLEINKITENSAELYWSVTGDKVFYGFQLEVLDESTGTIKTLDFPNSLREFVLLDLNPSLKYRFCIKMLASMGGTQDITDCKYGETLPSSYNNLLGPILGGVLGGIAFIVIISIVICCILWKRRSTKNNDSVEKPATKYYNDSYTNRPSSISASNLSLSKEIPTCPAPTVSGFTNQDQNNVLSFILATTTSKNFNSQAQETQSQISDTELDVPPAIQEIPKITQKKRSKKSISKGSEKYANSEHPFETTV